MLPRPCPSLLSLHRRRIVDNRPRTQKRCASKGGSRFWTPEKLEASEDYPLSLDLSEKLHPKLEPGWGTKKIFNLRPQIVSPDLCDDILKYIGPSLEKHKGCDVLDVNPGSGLWSRKLHEFLQPRSHILLEPAPEKFGHWLKPLLEAHGSKYKLIAADTNRFETYNRIVEDGNFPDQKRVSRDDRRLQDLNTSLLVTGSLCWTPPLPGVGFDSMAKQLYLRFGPASWTSSLFHAFGPVRTLFWMSADDFMYCLPKAEVYVGKSSFLLDKSSIANEVVTSVRVPRTASKATPSREPEFELETIIKAFERGKENGMEYPAHRRENAHDFADDIAQRSDGTDILRAAACIDYLEKQEKSGISTLGLNQTSVIECCQLEMAVEQKRKGKPTAKPKSPKVPNRTMGRPKVPEEEVEARRKRSTTKQRTDRKILSEKIVDIGMEIYHLECSIIGMDDSSEKEAAMQKLEELNRKFDDGISSVDLNHRSSVYCNLDDQLSIRTDVPRLQWDKRPYEPLIMQEKEAWPPHRMSLTDTVPRPIPEGQDADWFEWVQDFVSALLSTPTRLLPQALERMQPGASEIMAECPALHDPAKGGRLQMDQIRVRMLTLEQIDQLCAAYHNWPFKSPHANHNRYFQFQGSAKH